MAASRRKILQLLEALEARLGPAFLEAISEITSRAQLQQLVAALESNDIQAAIDAAGIRSGSWSTLTEATRAAYQTSGKFTMAADVPSKFGAMFDMNNPRAEKWIRDNSSVFVTRVNAEVKDSIRTILEAGLKAGRGSKSTALDIVGRISKQTGRRTGGIIGLSNPQVKYVADMRAALSGPLPVGVSRLDASGKPVKKFWIDDKGRLQSKYTLRDKRFDNIIKKAIEAGEKLSDADIERLVGRYSDRLLEQRGKAIARTEAQNALHEAADESLRQVVDQGLAPPDAVLRIWDSYSDATTRPAHAAMDNQPRGLNEAFVSGTGASMMHPGDSSLGAGAEDIVNCRCVVIHKIDFAAVEMAS